MAIGALASEPTLGWRGDGTGKFPSTEPPVTWGRVANVVMIGHWAECQERFLSNPILKANASTFVARATCTPLKPRMDTERRGWNHSYLILVTRIKLPEWGKGTGKTGWQKA